MVDITEALSADLRKLAVDTSSINLSFHDDFIWDWYIRLKVQLPVNGGEDLSSNLEDIAGEFKKIWAVLNPILGRDEGRICPETLVDSSNTYFWLIGIISLPSQKLSKCRQILREWQKETSQKMKGTVKTLEAKFIPRKIFLEHEFKVYRSPNPVGQEDEMNKGNSVKSKKEKKKEADTSVETFRKIKGSNPQEVRRQFLEHHVRVSERSSEKSNASQSGKLRPGREVLNRMKFDSEYNMEDYMVGYIDRKAGILEQSVEEWGNFGSEELMAYIKNVKDDEIVWDKARKIDLVFGKKIA